MEDLDKIYTKIDEDAKSLDFDYCWIAKLLEGLMEYLGIGWNELFDMLTEIHQKNDGDKRADAWRFRSFIAQLKAHIADVEKDKKKLVLDIDNIMELNHLKMIDLINLH